MTTFVLLSCLSNSPLSWTQSSPSSPQKQAEEELLAIHQQARQAHFHHDIDALLSHIGSEVIDIRDGKVRRMSAADVRLRFTEYFQHAEFTAWDDLDPPIVQASADGTQGWAIFRVHIAYNESDSQGSRKLQDSVMAWMASYKKDHGRWIQIAVANTEEHP